MSSWLADRLGQRLPRRFAGRLRVVLNGVDTQHFAYHPRPDRDQVNVLFFGRTIPEKGPDLVVGALQRLQRSDVALRVVGSRGFDPHAPLDRYEQELRRSGSELPGSAEFIPVVPREGVVEQLRWADIVVLPARWHDPCPLTLLEAMSTGAAIVMSDSGGMPEAAEDGAVTVPRDDGPALTEALRALVDDVAWRRSLGHLARRRAEVLSWAAQAVCLDAELVALGVPSSR